MDLALVQIDLYQGLGGIHPVRDSRNRISVRAWFRSSLRCIDIFCVYLQRHITDPVDPTEYQNEWLGDVINIY